MSSILKGFVCACILFCCLSCEKGFEIEPPATDARSVYNDLWQVMKERYALFSVKNIDWDSLHEAAGSTVDPSMSQTDLFRKCSEMLEVLKDGHVSLISNDRVYTYENFFRSYPVNFNLDNVVNRYLQGQYTKLGPIIYKVVNNVGYMHYASFREDITEDAVDLFFAEVASVKGLIIDLRSNSGGNISNVRKIFSRLISQRKLVKYEQYKRGAGLNDFYEREAFFLSPSGVQFTKPIVVLTNRSCFSACNDFVLYLSGLDNVTTVGDQTGGGGGIPANYILPNGWKLQYTSSITLSPEGKPIENGILPDLNIGILPIEETRGADPMLEKAYELLN